MPIADVRLGLKVPDEGPPVGLGILLLLLVLLYIAVKKAD